MLAYTRFYVSSYPSQQADRQHSKKQRKFTTCFHILPFKPWTLHCSPFKHQTLRLTRSNPKSESQDEVQCTHFRPCIERSTCSVAAAGGYGRPLGPTVPELLLRFWWLGLGLKLCRILRLYCHAWVSVWTVPFVWQLG